ncbi:transposase [Rouxiella badensis]|nr:transposase [Rouxiella badensis]
MGFSRPGKPTNNPFIESFSGSLWDECLNIHCFLSLEDMQEKLTGGEGNIIIKGNIHR